MMSLVQREQILTVFREKMIGVISTVDKRTGRPQSAVVAFSETDTLELIFGTFCDTRKFHNLEKYPQIAFVIGWDEVTIQYEGVACLLSGQEADRARTHHLLKNSKSVKYAFHEQQRFFRVVPTWVRYTDVSVDPEYIFEHSF